jgi:hypothetical protein
MKILWITVGEYLYRVHFSGSWFYIRLKITETPSFEMLKNSKKIPFLHY